MPHASQLALAPLLLAGVLSVAISAAALAAQPSLRVRASSLSQSRELWATVDVCSPPDQPNTIGIRGSMPGDGNAKDTMYMRLRLQYEQASGAWVDFAHGGDSGFLAVGAARSARQGGTSFQLKAVSSQLGYTLRGVVTFQWRHGAKVLHQATRTTTAGHRNVADADPPGYSTGQCMIS